jgi:hypothetical protein
LVNATGLVRRERAHDVRYSMTFFSIGSTVTPVARNHASPRSI